MLLMAARRRRWSTIVKAWEPFLADSLSGRLKLHATHYHGAPDREGRGWITLDGEQILSFGSLAYLMRVYGLSAELGAIGEGVDDAWGAAIAVAHREGLAHLSTFEEAVSRYPECTVEEALASPDVVTRGLAMVDRRLGKRRLATLELRTDESSIVQRLLDVRLEAEGMAERHATPAQA
jgi:hypothetical protein